MILVRDVFTVEFGRIREAVDLWKSFASTIEGFGPKSMRILTDYIGEYYTLVLESEYESLAAFDESMKQAGASKEWREGYHRVMPLLTSGHREVFNIVE